MKAEFPDWFPALELAFFSSSAQFGVDSPLASSSKSLRLTSGISFQSERAQVEVAKELTSVLQESDDFGSLFPSW